MCKTKQYPKGMFACLLLYTIKLLPIYKFVNWPMDYLCSRTKKIARNVHDLESTEI